jgi:DNA-binding winged helix-turn-helix (wHTH) protein/Tfp pilus assembly protein PilF/TolB-like protein
MKSQKQPQIAFASFVFDPENGQLMQNGVQIRANKQIVDLLELLLNNAGELVTREQIRKALWPDQEFLNHEKIITNAISRLRYILRDDPASPRCIESVPKRGYRLVAPVEQLFPSRTVEPALERPLSEPEPEFPLAISAAARPPRSRMAWRWSYAFALAALLTLSAIGWRWLAHRTASAVVPISLGIAPFDTSGDGARELAESFRLDLTDSLSQLPQVNVRAAHSLELFSLDESTFRERANKLGLDALLMGRFHVNGQQCHLELELVRGKDLVHIASFQYTVSRDELSGLVDKIQMETFRRLKLSASGAADSSRSIAQGGTSDPHAYDAYLRAGYHLSQQSKDSLRLALKEYDESIAADPHFAKAYAHEARTYFYLEQNSLIPEEEGFRKANLAARKALELDPSSAEAHAVLGIVYFLYNWNLPAGEREVREAIHSDPNQPFFHQGLALIFCDEGRFREALAELDLAHANDPFWVSAYVTEAHVASIAKDTSRLENTERKLMELAPDSPHARDAIANAEWNIGHYPEAIAAWRTMASIEGDADRMALEDRGLDAFRHGGAEAYAKIRLAAIQSGKGTGQHTNDFVAAEWYPVAGEPDQAMQAIHSGIVHHNSAMLGLAVLPAYDSLRRKPEFQAALTEAGLDFLPEIRK